MTNTHTPDKQFIASQLSSALDGIEELQNSIPMASAPAVTKALLEKQALKINRALQELRGL